MIIDSNLPKVPVSEGSAVVSMLAPKVKNSSSKKVSVALVGNFVPRKCGIATFTNDVYEKLREFHPSMAVEVYALDDPASDLEYENVASTIVYDDPQSYRLAARQINASGADVVWLQHEYGIFGGECGRMVCDFVDALAAPLVLTLHTVLSDPSELQHQILTHLISRASRIMVMSSRSRDHLADRYGAPHNILEVIEHGAPDRPFGRQEQFKAKLGHRNRTVMMTFGLLGPGKGLERVIEALPSIVADHPSLLYRIVGATHPNLVAKDGEAYREKLQALAEDLGVADHIEWDNRFVENDELLDQLEACDIYITPYFNLQQSTSGTLSYAVALGKAVVSTPYVHACELLADGVGVLIEPNDSGAIAGAVNRLLGDPDHCLAVQKRAWARGRRTIWPAFADAAASLIESALPVAGREIPITATPGVSGFLSMCDSTGIYQHGIGIVPDRRHGYCLDDNARALMLIALANGLTKDERSRLGASFAGFIQHAWNPDQRRFRNFMRFDRTWCEDTGSEDSNGRALWALGHHLENAEDPAMRRWALSLFDEVLGSIEPLGSPRAIGFMMLGAAASLRARPDHQQSREVLRHGSDFLTRLLGSGRRPDWAWFEAVLGYDNPRLSQALLEASVLLDDNGARDAGLETLDWIARQQTSASGQFRPIGSESFGEEHAYLPFDQQPLEAQAAIDAASVAYNITRDERWFDHAKAAWRWYFGANDRGAMLADMASGRCRDGITPRGVNENCGAESILAFQLSHYSMIAMVSDYRTPESGKSIEQASRR